MNSYGIDHPLKELAVTVRATTDYGSIVYQWRSFKGKKKGSTGQLQGLSYTS
jgi:hypothetical protein